MDLHVSTFMETSSREVQFHEKKRPFIINPFFYKILGYSMTSYESLHAFLQFKPKILFFQVPKTLSK